jgi:hypothetical protein
MKQDPKVARALRAARKCYADGGDVTTADVRRKLADQVTNRGTILPFADYADGSTRLAWPGILYEPAAAWKRMVDEGPTAEDSFTVASAVPIAGLAAAAVRPGASLGSGGGRLVKGDMPTYKGYHGTSDANYFVTKELVPNRMWMTGSRDDAAKAVANSYADRHYTGNPSAVIPVEGRFENPMIVDARGARWKEIPFEDTRLTADDLASEAVKRGHDGLVVENVKDQMVSYGSEPTIRTIAALRPGTVFDDFGNQLFSNSSKAATPGLAAVEANRVAKSLPMDEASRMARAREMGFDTERTYYHGTPKAGFENFKDIAYFTGNPELANIYADKRASALNPKIDENAPRGVYPVHLTDRNRLVVSDRRVGPDGSPRGSGWYPDNLQVALGLTNEDLKAAGGGSRVRRLYEIARDRGHDIVEIRDMMDLGGTQTQYVALDPRNIRSVNAAFDPDQIDSANLLAANSSKASTPGLAALESNRVRAYHGTTHEIEGKMRPSQGARGTAVYFSTSPDAASSYAMGDAGNYVRFAPDGNHMSVIPAEIFGKTFDEAATVSPKERRAMAEAYNQRVTAARKAEGKKVYPDELMDVGDFAGSYFDRAYPPRGDNVLQALSYEGDEQNALLRVLGYKGRMGNAAGLTGGRDVAMFEPGSVRNALTGDLMYSNPSTASVLSLINQRKDRE